MATTKKQTRIYRLYLDVRDIEDAKELTEVLRDAGVVPAEARLYYADSLDARKAVTGLVISRDPRVGEVK